MTIKKVIRKLRENLNEAEEDFLNYVEEELESFNITYLNSQRFIDKLNKISVNYFKKNQLNETLMYHYYLKIGIKFKIVLKEVEWSNTDILQLFNKELSTLDSVEKSIVVDKDVEPIIRNNGFYLLLFILKIIN